MNLKTKQNLTEAIYDYSLRLLGRFPKTARQLKLQLKQKFPETAPETIQETIEKLQSLHILNDRKMALDYAKSLFKQKNKSPLEVSLKMRNKGFESDLIKETIANVLVEINLADIAFKSAVKKINTLGKLTQKEKKAKIWIFLQRKAFPPGIIKKVIDALGI